MIAPEAWTDRGPCALCCSTDQLLERTIGGFPLRRCRKCGFLQTGRVLTPAALEDLYADGYGGLRQQQGQQINAKVNIAALRRLGLLTTPPGKLLDVGCGYGYLLHSLAGMVPKRAGLELATSEVSFARSTFGLDVAEHFDGLPTEMQADFDMIVMFEVLEHIANPISFLDGFARRLKKGGLLVVGTDNFTSWPARILGNDFPKWIPHQHVSLFDPTSLEGAMTRLDGMKTVARASYTAWELALRSLAFWATSGAVGARTYDLEGELSNENTRPFPLFGLRRLMNQGWFSLSARRDLTGEMMFIAARRI